MFIGFGIEYLSLGVAVYLVAFVVMPFLHIGLSNFVSLLGYMKLKLQLKQRLRQAGIMPQGLQAHFAGFCPEPNPRVYENHTVWDVGFLVKGPEWICFMGDHAQFSVPREKIVGISMVRGFPNWLEVPRICVRWQNDKEEKKSLHFQSLEGRSLLEIARKTKILLQDLAAWRERRISVAELPLDFNPPALPVVDDVRGNHPRTLLRPTGLITVIALIMIVIVGTGALYGLDWWVRWHASGLAIFSYLVGIIPILIYRD